MLDTVQYISTYSRRRWSVRTPMESSEVHPTRSESVWWVGKSEQQASPHVLYSTSSSTVALHHCITTDTSSLCLSPKKTEDSEESSSSFIRHSRPSQGSY